MDAYGEWQYALKHISEEDEAKILALPLLEKGGTVWTAGDIENEAIKGAFAIGGMDENAIDLSRLTCGWTFSREGRRSGSGGDDPEEIGRGNAGR